MNEEGKTPLSTQNPCKISLQNKLVFKMSFVCTSHHSAVLLISGDPCSWPREPKSRFSWETSAFSTLGRFISSVRSGTLAGDQASDAGGWGLLAPGSAKERWRQSKRWRSGSLSHLPGLCPLIGRLHSPSFFLIGLSLGVWAAHFLSAETLTTPFPPLPPPLPAPRPFSVPHHFLPQPLPPRSGSSDPPPPRTAPVFYGPAREAER